MLYLKSALLKNVLVKSKFEKEIFALFKIFAEVTPIYYILSKSNYLVLTL